MPLLRRSSSKETTRCAYWTHDLSCRYRTSPEEHRYACPQDPAHPVQFLSSLSDAEVYLKLENSRRPGPSGAGAFNKLLTVPDRKVIAASWATMPRPWPNAAGRLGKQATIVMPETAAIVKQERRGLRRGGGPARRAVQTMPLTTLFPGRKRIYPPFDDEAVIAGQGTADWRSSKS